MPHEYHTYATASYMAIATICAWRVPYFGGSIFPIFVQEKDDFLTTAVRTLFDENSLKQLYIRLCAQIFN